MNPWIRLYSGRQVNPLDVKTSDICIEDIAHGLALCNRFAGQTRKPISVAQHSVYASRICFADHANPRRFIAARQGLLHDAAEAYLGDVTKWLKHSDEMRAFRMAEEQLQRTIFRWAGLPEDLLPEVEEVDKLLVRFEGAHRDGFGPEFIIDHPRYGPLTKAEKDRVGKWGAWGWKWSEELFMLEYRTHFQ